ncbi:membrane protein [Streptomyces mashuensis]|uniref:Membrane protein n=1 Tax=Streptomyces mashuensis TaxID=33904 RepID=A0A919B2C5_9ACTN|nr:rhomboid-like protein [Streptomyces mashuensis]GHF42692.1 membrane protein [Streptomyces mashuensis]
MRPERLCGAVRAWVVSAPGTHIYLLIIGVTSLVVASASEGLEAFLLHRTSSNIHQLHRHPVQSLFISGFWIETPSSFLLYVVLFEVLHANVERWAGTARWLFTVALAHVAATLISQEILLQAIESHSAPRSMKHVVDIGVSYGLAGSTGLLAYRVPRPWRWPYVAGAVAFFGVPLLAGGTFTDTGHAVALCLGLACGPLTRGRPVWGLPRPRALLAAAAGRDPAFSRTGRTAAPAPPRSRPRRSRR